MSRSKNSCRRGKDWQSIDSLARREGKRVEHKRTRTRERAAVARGVETPLRDSPWQRWSLWNWD